MIGLNILLDHKNILISDTRLHFPSPLKWRLLANLQLSVKWSESCMKICMRELSRRNHVLLCWVERTRSCSLAWKGFTNWVTQGIDFQYKKHYLTSIFSTEDWLYHLEVVEKKLGLKEDFRADDPLVKYLDDKRKSDRFEDQVSRGRQSSICAPTVVGKLMKISANICHLGKILENWCLEKQ